MSQHFSFASTQRPICLSPSQSWPASEGPLLRAGMLRWCKHIFLDKCHPREYLGYNYSRPCDPSLCIADLINISLSVPFNSGIVIVHHMNTRNPTRVTVPTFN